jgi:predicted amidohydrolase
MGNELSQHLSVSAVQPFQPLDAEDCQSMQKRGWALARQAAQRGAKLIVLPEYFNTFGLPPDQVLAASRVTSTQKEMASRFSREFGAWLLLPLIEERQGKRFNTAHLFDRAGDIVHTYDKTHLTVGERDAYALTAGDKIDVAETPFGLVGVMICYDIYFPEVARILSLKGARLILFPSLQRSDTEEGCMLLNRARAMDNTCFLIRSSYGQKSAGAFVPGNMYGGTCIVGPDGSILANAGRYEGLAEATIQPSWDWQRPRCGGMPVQSVREFLNEDRRPALYAAETTGQTD